MEKCIKLLKKNPKNRNSKDIQNLVNSTSKLLLFLSYDQFDKQQIHQKCCKIMTLAHFPKQSYIFMKGQLSFDMYIILKGEVQVLNTPSVQPYQQKIDQEVLSDQSFVKPTQIQIARLHPGQHFGNLSLLNNMPRNASIKCLTPVSLAVISNKHKPLIQKLSQSGLEQTIKFLKTVEIFKNWTKVSLQKLSLSLKPRIYKKGDKIYNEGDQARQVFIIRKGEIKMTKSHFINNSQADPAPKYCSKGNLLKFKRGFRRRELAVVIKSSKQVFGYQEVFNQQKTRTESAYCFSSSAEVFVMSYQTFNKQVQSPDTKALIIEHNQIQNQWKQNRYRSLESVDNLLYNWTFTPVAQIQRKPKALNPLPPSYHSRSISLLKKKEKLLKKQSTVKPLPPIVKNIITSRSFDFQTPKFEKPILTTFPTEIFEPKEFSGRFRIKSKYFN